MLWLRRDWRAVVGVAIGVAAAYQGFALLGTLRNAYVLAVVPAWVERGAASVSLAAGLALLLVTILGSAPTRERDEAERRRDAARQPLARRRTTKRKSQPSRSATTTAATITTRSWLLRCA